MDRNIFILEVHKWMLTVALRKESVDRNKGPCLVCHRVRMSLSARRAWIEIVASITTYVSCAVALRKESVDRNGRSVLMILERPTSLSARRAWIEIRLFTRIA